jgi:hypothetical protein
MIVDAHTLESFAAILFPFECFLDLPRATVFYV